MKTPRLLLPAEEEMLEAAFYIMSNDPAVWGRDFLRKVQNAVDEIVQHPARWPKVRGNIRRRMIHRFPYAILYEDQPQAILIIAVMHLRRHPNYWIDRTH